MDIILKTRFQTAIINSPKSICIEKIAPCPSFPKRGFNPSLFLPGEPACVRGQREFTRLWRRRRRPGVRRDFITECSFNFETLNSLYGSEESAPGRFSI